MPLRLFSRAVKVIRANNSFLINNAATRISLCGCKHNFYSTKTTSTLNPDVDPATEAKKRKKTNIIPKITLLSGDELTITTLEEAQKLSIRRDLKLVKIVDLDTKTHRPVYKLMTGSEYHAEDLKQREQRKNEKQKGALKGEKVLMLRHNISEHDLQTDIKKISKWISKLYEVRVVINGDSSNMEKAEKVCSLLEESLKSEARFLQKRQKGSDIKFQILPLKKDKNSDIKSL